MRYLFLFLFIYFTAFSYSFAAKVSPEDAQKVAVNWKKYIHSQQLKSNNSIIQSTGNNLQTPKSQELTTYNGQNTFYTINFKGGGFVIVSADDNVNPILGWSDTDSLPANTDNENLKYWLEKYNQQIYYSINQQINNSTNQLKWNNILQNTFIEKSKNSVTPFLTTKWDQGQYYNTSCPIDSKGPDGHVVTGCVATALAQIMKYNNCPAHGTGSYTYTAYPYGSLSADFGNTTYNWSNMSKQLFFKNNDVANLIYQCGVAVSMSYSATASSSYDSNALRALKKYFGYTSASLISKSNYSSDTAWENVIKANLELSLPVYYSGIDASLNSGHAFVCDGYNGDYFHFNWGWSGQYNSFFLLSAMNPNGYKFTTNEEAIINIIPQYTLTGKLLYDNTSQTPINGQKIVLTNISSNISATDPINTTITDADGNYVFNNVKPGNYIITPQISLSVGGFDPLDGLLCNKFSNNLYSFTDQLLKRASYVSTEKDVNPTNADLINQRYTGLITSYQQPDWMYIHDTIHVSNTNVVHNCSVVCTGDVNGSYDFSSRNLTDFSFSAIGNINMQLNKEFELPVYINNKVTIGALGLSLTCSDTMFQILDVIPNLSGLIYKVNGNNVKIAWSADVEGYSIQTTSPLFYLKIISKGIVFGQELSFTADNGSLMTDFNGKVFPNENIVIPKLLFNNKSNVFSISNFPNPFNGNTNIQFLIPTDSQVNIKLYDYTGRQVSTIVNEYMKAGSYFIPFSATGLHSGIYLYRTELNKSSISTGKMVIID